MFIMWHLLVFQLRLISRLADEWLDFFTNGVAPNLNLRDCQKKLKKNITTQLITDKRFTRIAWIAS